MKAFSEASEMHRYARIDLRKSQVSSPCNRAWKRVSKLRVDDIAKISDFVSLRLDFKTGSCCHAGGGPSRWHTNASIAQQGPEKFPAVFSTPIAKVHG